MHGVVVQDLTFVVGVVVEKELLLFRQLVNVDVRQRRICCAELLAEARLADT